MSKLQRDLRVACFIYTVCASSFLLRKVYWNDPSIIEHQEGRASNKSHWGGSLFNSINGLINVLSPFGELPKNIFLVLFLQTSLRFV